MITMKNQPSKQNPSQQGDLILIPIESLPAGSQEIISQKHCILAHGESGHSHVLDHPKAKMIKINNSIFLDLEEAATILHEEHKEVSLESGIWEIGQVNEYDYFSKMVRKVID